MDKNQSVVSAVWLKKIPKNEINHFIINILKSFHELVYIYIYISGCKFEISQTSWRTKDRARPIVDKDRHWILQPYVTKTAGYTRETRRRPCARSSTPSCRFAIFFGSAAKFYRCRFTSPLFLPLTFDGKHIDPFGATLAKIGQ